ncbi:MAG: adenylyltransferase/cytidyltransferase family protein [Gemmatimonadales bacterium]|nr:adenylyltransferase/cytidyltransferase family protein [Gemmatimonadales bacterium]
MPGTASKLVSLAAAVEWRRSLPGPLVFTNGVFDLLHPGHVEYLESARALGGALIVAVNSDDSARALGKGPNRPVAAAAARARVLAALAAVDRVILFDQPTPLHVIEALAPDILVKGGDYRRDTIVGADIVEAKGGRVITIPLVPGYSTTSLVERSRAPS